MPNDILGKIRLKRERVCKFCVYSDQKLMVDLPPDMVIMPEMFFKVVSLVCTLLHVYLHSLSVKHACGDLLLQVITACAHTTIC